MPQRSSLIFRRHSSTSLVDSDIPDVSSPSKVDPFQSTPTYPLPTVRGTNRPRRPDRLPSPTQRPKPGLSRKQTLLESRSTPTPKIVLASPSTSTIHYLFPGDNSSSHLSASSDSRVRYTAPDAKRLNRRSLTYDYAPVIESGSQRLSKPRTVPKHSPKDSLDCTKGLKTRSESVDPGRPSTVLGPTKRVPSGSKRDSIGTRLKQATATAPHASLSLRSISPISSPIVKAQSMRTLRRQPSLADLGRKVRKGEACMPALMERENHVEMPVKGPTAQAGTRKRSQSLSSEHRSRPPRSIVTAPTTPIPPAPGSPVLPPPDLGDPLEVTIHQSPSFSHLEYSTAGSSLSRSVTPSSRQSRQPEPIFTYRDAQSPCRAPVSAAMGRSTTREGLGAYDRPKQIVKDDLERRLARDEERGRAFEKLTRGGSDTKPRRFSLRRSQSLKRAPLPKETGRARSQSLSAKSVRQMGISPPSTLERPKSEIGRGIYLGDLNVDLGGRFLLEASLLSSDDKSPRTSLYPQTTPSSGYSSLPHSTDPSSFPSTTNPPQTEFPCRRDSVRSEKYRGRPLHPAFASSTSLLASSIGLGLGTPVSLPESLMEEAIDLTGQGWGRPKSERAEDVTITLGEQTQCGMSKPPNQFFIPPYPNSLRMTRSLGPGVLRNSYETPPPPRPARSPSRGPPTPKEERSDPFVPEPIASSNRPPKTPKGVGRVVTLPSSFSLCSPPDAIEPLPPLSGRQLRNNKSSSFLSASASLRGLFRRERIGPLDGTESRITASSCCTGMVSPVDPEVKFRGRVISSPMDLDTAQKVTIDERPKRYGASGESPRKPGTIGSEEQERARRERILSEALSQSLRAKRDVTPVSPPEEPRMVQSTSKSRMAIPAALLAAAPIEDDTEGDVGDHGSANPPLLESHLSVDSSPPRPFSPQISKWSPSPMKPKRRRLKGLVGSPGIPSLSLHNARSMVSLHKAKDSITLSVNKTMGDRASSPDAGPQGSLKVVYESPRRSLSAERDRHAIAQHLGSVSPIPEDVFSSPPQERPGTPRRIRGSTLPSGSSLTPRSQRTRNPHTDTFPSQSGGSGRWRTATGYVADRARRFFSPEMAYETRRPQPSTVRLGGVSSDDPPVRTVLEVLIQQEEDERAQDEIVGLESDHGAEEDDRGSSQGVDEDVAVSKTEAKRQSRCLSHSSIRVDRTRKVMDWCEAVDGTKDLRAMEDRWRAHVEEERERLRRIGERKE